MNSFFKTVLPVYIVLAMGLAVVSAGTVEKREMPPSNGYGGAPGYENGGGYGGGGYDNTGMVPFGGGPGVGPGGPGGPGGLPPPFGFKDPGVSFQTGFEGFLVPNSWYGLLPWGIEGVVIVIVGIIVFTIIVVAIIVVIAWLCGFGDYSLVKEQARNLLPSHFDLESLSDISSAVFDANDKYNELSHKRIN